MSAAIKQSANERLAHAEWRAVSVRVAKLGPCFRHAREEPVAVDLACCNSKTGGCLSRLTARYLLVAQRAGVTLLRLCLRALQNATPASALALMVSFAGAIPLKRSPFRKYTFTPAEQV